jgi:hypothetical protein
MEVIQGSKKTEQKFQDSTESASTK